MPEVLGFGKKCLKPFLYVYARVAELADALDLGSSGRPWGFKSLRAHQNKYVSSKEAYLFWFSNQRDLNRIHTVPEAAAALGLSERQAQRKATEMREKAVFRCLFNQKGNGNRRFLKIRCF